MILICWTGTPLGRGMIMILILTKPQGVWPGPGHRVQVAQLQGAWTAADPRPCLGCPVLRTCCNDRYARIVQANT